MNVCIWCISISVCEFDLARWNHRRLEQFFHGTTNTVKALVSPYHRGWYIFSISWVDFIQKIKFIFYLRASFFLFKVFRLVVIFDGTKFIHSSIISYILSEIHVSRHAWQKESKYRHTRPTKNETHVSFPGNYPFFVTLVFVIDIIMFTLFSSKFVFILLDYHFARLWRYGAILALTEWCFPDCPSSHLSMGSFFCCCGWFYFISELLSAANLPDQAFTPQRQFCLSQVFI